MGSDTRGNNYFRSNGYTPLHRQYAHAQMLRQHSDCEGIIIFVSPGKGSGSALSPPGMKGVISNINQVAAS